MINIVQNILGTLHLTIPKTQSHAVVFMVWLEEIQAESYSTLQICVKLQWNCSKVSANQSLTEFQNATEAHKLEKVYF